MHPNGGSTGDGHVGPRATSEGPEESASAGLPGKPDAKWMDSFPELKDLRDVLRRRRANGEIDFENIRDLNVLQAWSNALAGLDREALESFVEETFVELGLATEDEAQFTISGLRLFRRREWNSLSPHIKKRLLQHERLTASITGGFRKRLERALDIVRGGREQPLAEEFKKTGSSRNDLLEIKGAMEFMGEVAEKDPFLRCNLQRIVREVIKDPEILNKAITWHEVPVHRIGTLIRQAVSKILDTVISLETRNIKAQHPKLYGFRRARAIAALTGHLRRARELGCGSQIRSLILDRLKPHPIIFKQYFGACHPLA